MTVATRPRYRRFMSGSSSRLAAHYTQRQHKSTTETAVPYRRATLVDLDAAIGTASGTLGSVRVWRTVVLHEKAQLPAREFAPASGAEVWTLNGQTHVTRSDAHFRSKRVGLDALVGRLLVEVELDELSQDAKADVVTTSRYTRAQKDIGARLDQAIDEVLADDDELQRLSAEIREAAFKRAASQRIAGLDSALRAFALTFERMKKVKVPGLEGGRPRPELKPLPPIEPLHEDPCDVFQFRLVLRDRIRVKRGSTASIQLEADALDGYFDDPSRLSLQFVPSIGEKLRIVGRDSLVAGRMRIRMKAARDAPLVQVVMHASCITPSGILNAEVPVEVVEPKSPRGPEPGRRGRQREIEVPERRPPAVMVRYKDDPERPWLENWSASTVGQFSDGVANINGDYEELVRLRRDLPVSQHDDITNLYIAPVAMSIVGLEDAETDAPKGTGGEDVLLHEHYRSAALRSAALSSIFAIRYMRKAGLVDVVDKADADTTD